MAADRALVEEVRDTLGELGLVRVTENAIYLLEDRTLQELENRRAQRAVDQPTVGSCASGSTSRAAWVCRARPRIWWCAAGHAGRRAPSWHWASRTCRVGPGNPPTRSCWRSRFCRRQADWAKALDMAGPPVWRDAGRAGAARRQPEALRDRAGGQAEERGGCGGQAARAAGALGDAVRCAARCRPAQHCTSSAAALVAALAGPTARPLVEVLAGCGARDLSAGDGQEQQLGGAAAPAAG